MLTVTTFLWSDPARHRSYKFGAEHVAILRNMVARNLTIPHEFVCVCSWDFVDALRSEDVRCVGIDGRKHVPGSCFVRLMLRRPDIASVLGPRILNLDLDCVIVDSLDLLVSRTEECVWWRNPNFADGSASRAFYQTSIQLFDAGSHSELWTEFDPKETPRWVNRRFGGAEQAWVSERVPWDEPYWDDSDGIYGAGRLFKGKVDKGVTTELPENARIVFLPGDRAPHQPETQEIHPWIKDHYR